MSDASEKYIILLLGIKDRPMPSLLHLQKEMYIASKAIPKITTIFDFENHYNGPYSQILQERTEEPMYYDNACQIQKNGTVNITGSGKKIFNELIEQYTGNKRFSDMLVALEMTRMIYDKFTKDELLFLVYRTYPECSKASNIYDNLVMNEKNRNRLAYALFSKNLVTEERYNELKKNDG